MTDLVPVEPVLPVPDLFTVAVLKGAVEGDVTKHFAALGGLAWHVATAQALGLIGSDGESATVLGRQVYDRHGLADLPPARAYLAWVDARVVDAVVADLRAGVTT